MRAQEVTNEQRKRKKPRSAAYGPGAFGMYGTDAGYSGDGGVAEDAEPIDREFALVKKLGRLGQRIVENPKLWEKYSDAIDNDDIDWIISLIQEGTGADKDEIMNLSDLFGEIGGGLGRIIDFAWAVKEGTWEEDFMNPYRQHRNQDVSEGKFRANDIEEYKPGKEALNDLKSRFLPDWEMLDHKTLQAKYVAKDHRHAEQFTKFINKLSERMDHFAEVTQNVAEITVKTATFDVKGLTILDFQLAMIVDNFAKKADIEQVRMSGNFGMHENFADGKNPQDKGDAKRHGVNTKASVSSLRKTAKQGGRKGQLAHWMANMKAGKAKKNF